MDTQGAENYDHYGRATARLVAQTYAEGVQRALLLMRHSARTFDRTIHDLLNPLTDHGRALSLRLGQELPIDLHVRGYASPPERCMETAKLVIAGHERAGGSGARTRPVEAFGIFYALDQQKMWKGMSQAESMVSYLQDWFDGGVPDDAMMPADLAVTMMLRAMIGKLRSPTPLAPGPQLDLCVTHDMSLYTLRHGVGLENLQGPDVEFLDGLLLFERDGRYVMRSQHGAEVLISV